MKENRYDDPAFFEQYSQMSRSAEGLAAAGEWETLQELQPPVAGKTLLDIGCGYGWHAQWAAEQGAAHIVATDISEKMLAVAAEKHSHPAIEYRRIAAEDLQFSAGSFDLVFSSLALHYIEDYAALAQNIYHWLRPGGHFVFSVEHPVFTAAGPQQWLDAGTQRHLCWPVDRYFEEGERQAIFLGQPVGKYHRTLETYVDTLLRLGFRIGALREPVPSAAMLEKHPEWVQELRRPMMLLVAAQK